jgi:hypothetical protein
MGEDVQKGGRWVNIVEILHVYIVSGKIKLFEMISEMGVGRIKDNDGGG